ncbi:MULTISPECIES: acyltransferase family protein [Arthrobacter]|uniref:Acyltransferase family protein n=2 Tax=Arthrobacter TaxID=1663 RepID=A0ABU9KNJ7_9MICC|nr:acyltransferase family protein [Arthrobacter sp. YJM1]MDP5227235.1 acyltransferase family protein [Arthrobacter sp. YJM1]
MAFQTLLTRRTRRPRQAQPAKFRADIQALRAFAVTAVVLNHFWVERLPGGYIGVDVFFVISGYLITRHLMDELSSTGRLKFGQFYARRMRRLLPAALLVSLAGLAGAWFILPFSRWTDVAQETLASAFYAENWVLAAKSIDYSASHDLATTVQHYWSLSVEEQFYLVWPVLLAGAFLLAGRLRKSRLAVVAGVMVVVFAASLVFCILYTDSNKNEAYFVTTTRAWEFAAGALLALLAIRLGDASASRASAAFRTFWHVLGVAGATTLLVTVVAFNDRTPFPGYMALVPVLATGAIILSGTVLGRSAVPGAGWGPLQYLGDVSYSLYLWHWPVLMLAIPLLGDPMHSWQRALLVLLSVVLAALSKKFIEDPGRKHLFRGRPSWNSLVAGLGGMAVVGVVSFAMVFSVGVAQQQQAAELASLSQSPCYGARSMENGAQSCSARFGPPRAENIGATEAPWFNVPECKTDADPIVVQGSKRLDDCDFSGGRKDAVTAWLVGDSHAEQWKAAIIPMARKLQWHLKLSLLGGCPVVDVKRIAFMDAPSLSASTQNRCLEWSQKVSDRILAAKPDRVIVSAFASKETIDDGTGRNQQAQYRDAVQRRITPWVKHGSKVTIIRDTPLTLKTMSPTCLSSNSGKPLACSTARASAVIPDPVVAAVEALKPPRTGVVDMTDQFCDASRCYAAIGGLYVYFDGDHVARSYVGSMAALFERRFETADGKV